MTIKKIIINVKKEVMKKTLLVAGVALLSIGLNAQVGINAGKTTEGDPHDLASDAVFHVENRGTEHKGVLLPKVSLTSATDQQTTSGGSVTKGLLVWNTGTGGLSPAGYYYWDGTKWVQTSGGSGLEKITENGKTGWRLAGANPSNYGNIGDKAVDFSENGSASTTRGATGDNAVAFGEGTTASGGNSFAMGKESVASGWNAAALGRETIASGNNSLALGMWNEDVSSEDPALLIVGNGTNNRARKNALVVYKDGKVKAKGINDTNGGNSDKIVVTSSDGTLKSINRSSLGVQGPRGEQGPAGPRGERGPAGAAGAQGPTGVVSGANGIDYNSSTKTVSLPTGTNGQVLKWNGTKWAPANISTGNNNNIYSANGSLSGNRTVTQANHDLTFTTGTGKFIINGTSKLNGGSYVKTKIVTGNEYTVTDDDYYIAVRNNLAQVVIKVPFPSQQNAGRVLIITNNASDNVAIQTPDGQQALSGTEAPSIPLDRGMWIINDGTRWFNLINY